MIFICILLSVWFVLWLMNAHFIRDFIFDLIEYFNDEEIELTNEKEE